MKGGWINYNTPSNIRSRPPPLKKDMNKRVIVQYNDLKREEQEVKVKIERLEKEVRLLEDKLSKIDAITDVVKGANGET